MTSYIFSDIISRSTSGEVPDDLLEDLLYLAVEIAREGREGRKIGTILIVGDTEAVLAHSRPLILDPLLGHDEETTKVSSPDVRETVKELAQLDGAFVISDSGSVVSAARYIDGTATGLDIPLGLGSRHIAAASITKKTRAIAIVVSESSVVRVFDRGELVAEIIPELWMLKKHGLLDLGADSSKKVEQEVTVVTRAGGPDPGEK